MVYMLVLVILGGANAGNQSLRVGHYRSLASWKPPQLKPKGLDSRKEPLGLFACAPLVHPTLPPQDSCTFVMQRPRHRFAEAGPCMKNRIREWRGWAGGIVAWPRTATSLLRSSLRIHGAEHCFRSSSAISR